MGELGTVEIKTDGALWAVLWTLQPQKLRLWIYVAFDQPRTGQAVGPGTSPGGPSAAAVFGGVHVPDPARCCMRLAWGQHRIGRSCQIFQSVVGLIARRTREEILLHYRVVVASQPRQLRCQSNSLHTFDLPSGAINPAQQLLVLRCPIEQSPKLCFLLRVAGIHLQDLSAAAGRNHILRLRSQRLVELAPIRKQVDAVAQDGSAECFECPPHAHSYGGLLALQSEDEQDPRRNGRSLGPWRGGTGLQSSSPLH